MSKAAVESREQVFDKETSTGSNRSNEIFEQQPQRTKRGRIGAILKRFWWAFLIVFAIGVLVVTLPLVLVGFPKIIQGKLDAAQVTMQGIRITQPKPNSVYMELNSTILSGGGISATIDPFNASLYLEDKAGHVPFAYLNMPQTSSAKVVTVNVSQELEIWNAQSYTDFNTWFLLNESFRVTLDGNTHVRVKGLKPTKVNFHKTITLKGLNGFQGLDVSSFNISLIPDALGDNFHGFATIPNPSILTVEIGNATFNSFLNTTNIGHLFIDNLTLVPGTNSVPIRANISQSPVLTAAISPAYCKTGIMPLGVIGDSVLADGEHLVYYETGFRENLNTVNINVGAALAQTLGNPITCET